MQPLEPYEESAQRMIEVIIGPCTRREAEDAGIDVQELLDEHLPELNAAISVHFEIEGGTTDG